MNVPDIPRSHSNTHGREDGGAGGAVIRSVSCLSLQGAVTPIDAVVAAATGVTICDQRKNAVTLWTHPKNACDPVIARKILLTGSIYEYSGVI